MHAAALMLHTAVAHLRCIVPVLLLLVYTSYRDQGQKCLQAGLFQDHQVQILLYFAFLKCELNCLK
jgi:hypothetical protein